MQKILLAIIIILASSSGNFINSTYAAEKLNSSCNDVEFIFARGSGESLNDVSFQAWHDNIKKALVDTNLNYDFYELGTKSYSGYQYPAVAVAGGLEEIVNLVDAYFSGGSSHAFGASVREGMIELNLHIRSVRNMCPQTKFVLGGYSQGAMVMSKSLPDLDASRILYVATFGDPKLYLPEGQPNAWFPWATVDACRGVNLSPYRTYVPDCRAYEGVLGSIRPYQPTAYIGKIGTWCNQSDIMCSSGLSIDDHIAYVSSDLYADAAQHIRKKVVAAFPDKITTNHQRNRHDVAFLIDATGSMNGIASQYKAEAERLAKKVLAAGGRVSLYNYRDYNDSIPLQELCNFTTCTADNFAELLDTTDFNGGGDAPESLLSAAYRVMRLLSWTPGATKSIVVLTDEGFHSPDLDGTTLEQVVNLSLIIDPVNFYIIAPQYAQKYYTELTQLTNGKVFGLGEAELSTEQIFNRPVAKLSLPAYSGEVGEEFWFDASESYGFGDDDLTFDWDLDGDGEFEMLNTGAKVRQTYSTNFDDFIKVRVSDNAGSSTMAASVKVSTDSAKVAKIKITGAETLTNGSVKISFTAENTQKVLLSMNDAILGLVKIDDDSGEIVINDLGEEAVITLVPYSEEDQRGIADSLRIDNGKVSDNNQKLPETGNNYTSPTLGGSDNQDHDLPDTFNIPKAPNTGVRKTAIKSK